MASARMEAMERRVLLSATLLPDATFGGGRVVLDAENLLAFGQALYALPDGDVLVAGRAVPDEPADSADSGLTRQTGVVVARYNADGSLDPGFGGRGWVFTDRLTRANALTAQPDGKVLVAGAYYPSTGRSDEDFASRFAAVRLLPDGSPDISFGGDGDVTIDFPGGLDRAHDVAIDAAGNIVLVGSTFIPATRTGTGASVTPRSLYVGTSRLAVARLTAGGAPDPTFDGDGMAMPQAPGQGTVGSAVVTTATSEIVLGGSGSEGAFVLKLRADGSVDPSFGTGGATLLPRTAGVSDLLLLADGDLLAVGNAVHDPPVDYRDPESVRNTPARLALARLNPDGSAEVAFGSGGVVVEEARLSVPYFIDLAVRQLADGTFAVGGADYFYAYAAVFGADGGNLQAAVSDRTYFGGHPGVALQADGKLLVTGHTAGTTPHAIVTARYVLADVPPEEPPGDPAPILSARFLGRPVYRTARTLLFRVAYRVAEGFDAATLRTPGAVQVTGPTGTTYAARLLRLDRLVRDNVVIGLYRLTAPVGLFDGGRYTVRLGAPLAAQVAVGDGVAGVFDVLGRRTSRVSAAQIAALS